MNVELLKKTRDRIANPDLKFDMEDWCHCIAGHACEAAGMEIITGQRYAAADFLGFGPMRADWIFSQTHLSRQGAIGLLDQLIAEAQHTDPVEPMRIPPDLDPDPDEVEQEDEEAPDEQDDEAPEEDESPNEEAPLEEEAALV